MIEAPQQGFGGRFAIRRILAAFGPATMSAGTLEGAVDLAGRLGAELETLFVEDTALLEWMGLPFIRQVSLHGLASMPVSQPELELQFRALAAEAQPSVRLLIGAVSAPVLLLRSAQPARGPMHVVLEQRGEAERLLEAAIAMAASYADSSIITAWEEAAFDGEPDDAFARAAPVLRVRRFSGPADVETLLGAVAAGTLVLSARSGLLKLQTWWRHFAGARCALLLVR
jgi:hypothetical protein